MSQTPGESDWVTISTPRGEAEFSARGAELYRRSADRGFEVPADELERLRGELAACRDEVLSRVHSEPPPGLTYETLYQFWDPNLFLKFRVWRDEDRTSFSVSTVEWIDDGVFTAVAEFARQTLFDGCSLEQQSRVHFASRMNEIPYRVGLRTEAETGGQRDEFERVNTPMGPLEFYKAAAVRYKRFAAAGLQVSPDEMFRLGTLFEAHRSGVHRAISETPDCMVAGEPGRYVYRFRSPRLLLEFELGLPAAGMGLGIETVQWVGEEALDPVAELAGRVLPPGLVLTRQVPTTRLANKASMTVWYHTSARTRPEGMVGRISRFLRRTDR